jgi:hypothetical protein
VPKLVSREQVTLQRGASSFLTRSKYVPRL